MTDVFVLVGTNPLPCYVSAVFLKRYYGYIRLYLVCSGKNDGVKQTGTVEYAQRVKDVLENNPLFNGSKIEISHEISDVGSQGAIDKILKPLMEKCEHVHLNYTGGTKAMVAHAFHRLMSLKGDIEKSSSYLDVRRSCMIIDGEDVDDLSILEKEDWDFDMIARLHGHHISKGETKDYPVIYDKMAGLLESDKLNEVYGDSKRLSSKDPGVRCCEEKRVEENYEEIMKLYSDSLTTSEKKRLRKYINGTWLEEYLYIALQHREGGIKYYFDVQSKLDGTDLFQLDIVAMYGYKITVISVTTDAKKELCKLKAFEANMRARQLGGDEVRTIMVTFMPDASLLEQDMMLNTGSRIPYFKAFGIKEIQDKSIIEGIISFIKEES